MREVLPGPARHREGERLLAFNSDNYREAHNRRCREKSGSSRLGMRHGQSCSREHGSSDAVDTGLLLLVLVRANAPDVSAVLSRAGISEQAVVGRFSLLSRFLTRVDLSRLTGLSSC